MLTSNVSDLKQQEGICTLLDRHMVGNGYDCNERMEVKVKEAGTSDRLLSHVKVARNGSISYYDYHEEPYITADSVLIPSGDFATDSIGYFDDKLYVLHYSYDVKRDSSVLYNVDLKTARQSTPQHEELDELAKEIEKLLKQ